MIAVLREQESGATTAEDCRRHGISEQTYRWKAKYRGLGWRNQSLSLIRQFGS